MKHIIILLVIAVVWAESEKKKVLSEDNQGPELQTEEQKQPPPQSQSNPPSQLKSQPPDQRGRQILLYNNNLIPFDGPLHVPQDHFPGFIHERPLHPRLEPQLLVYPGGAGQPFLLQPGGPGNFLIPHPQPQPGPGIVLRDGPGIVYGNDQPQAQPQPGQPPRPIFVAGFPKPAHVPKIEPEAEEIPTDPQAIPPFKPQKIGGELVSY